MHSENREKLATFVQAEKFKCKKVVRSISWGSEMVLMTLYRKAGLSS